MTSQGPGPSVGRIGSRHGLTSRAFQVGRARHGPGVLRSGAVLEVLGELLLVIAAAAAGVALFERLRLPAIAGFLVMGAVLGPGGLGLARDPARIRELAELGVVFLLFEIGLELPMDTIRRLWRPALLTGGLQVGVTVAAVTAGASMLGVPLPRALLLGGLVSMSSTALVMRILADRAEIDSPHGRLCVGTLLFQDLCIVPMLLAVPILAGEAPTAPAPIAGALAKSAAALAVLFVVARFALPFVVEQAARLGSGDLFSLLAFVVVLGSAVAAEHMGLTLAVGAFSAGIVLAASPYAHQVVAEIAPLRGLLLGIFFTAVGMLFDPGAALSHATGVGAYVAAAMVGKALIVFVIVLGVMRQGTRLAALTGIALAQTGEFSFVLAGVAATGGLLDPALLQVFIAGSLVTLLATPFLMDAAPRIAEVLAGVAEREEAPAVGGLAAPDAVLIGFGLTGRMLARALRNCGLSYVAVETNARSVAEACAAGESVVFGDATRRTILARVGVPHARLVSIAVSDPVAARRVVGLARALAPQARIVVRTRYVAEMDALYELGASLVVAEEFEATLDMLSAVLQSLGIAGERAQRLAEEVRAEGYEALRIPPALLLEPWLEEVLRDVSSAWLEVSEGPAAGCSIAELGVRARTGASIVALRHEDTTLVNPSAERRLEVGDRVLAIGDAEALARLCALIGPAV